LLQLALRGAHNTIFALGVTSYFVHFAHSLPYCPTAELRTDGLRVRFHFLQLIGALVNLLSNAIMSDPPE